MRQEGVGSDCFFGNFLQPTFRSTPRSRYSLTKFHFSLIDHLSIIPLPGAEISGMYLVIAPQCLGVALGNQSPRLKYIAAIGNQERHMCILFHQ